MSAKMKNSDKKPSLAEKQTPTGKKLVQARLPFKVLSTTKVSSGEVETPPGKNSLKRKLSQDNEIDNGSEKVKVLKKSKVRENVGQDEEIPDVIVLDEDSNSTPRKKDAAKNNEINLQKTPEGNKKAPKADDNNEIDSAMTSPQTPSTVSKLGGSSDDETRDLSTVIKIKLPFSNKKRKGHPVEALSVEDVEDNKQEAAEVELETKQDSAGGKSKNEVVEIEDSPAKLLDDVVTPNQGNKKENVRKSLKYEMSPSDSGDCKSNNDKSTSGTKQKAEDAKLNVGNGEKTGVNPKKFSEDGRESTSDVEIINLDEKIPNSEISEKKSRKSESTTEKLEANSSVEENILPAASNSAGDLENEAVESKDSSWNTEKQETVEKSNIKTAEIEGEDAESDQEIDPEVIEEKERPLENDGPDSMAPKQLKSKSRTEESTNSEEKTPVSTPSRRSLRSKTPNPADSTPKQSKESKRKDEDLEDVEIETKTPKQLKLSPGLTPKQRKKFEEAEKRQKEREEKELQRKKEKEEKEEQKRKEREEKEEQRRKEREEKEEQKRKEKEEKEKKRLAEVEAKNEERRLKDEERKKRDEAKEEERKKKEEEKRKKEEEAEMKKKKAAQAFTKFFVQKPAGSEKKIPEIDQYANSVVNLSITNNFMPFQIKENMKMAPAYRRMLLAEEKKVLDLSLDTEKNINPVGVNDLYLKVLTQGKYCPRKDVGTLPYEGDDVVMIEDELEGIGETIDESKVTQRYRTKYLLFHENRRPPYYGTWMKKSKTIKARRPFATDEIFDYEVDSDEEWEEEEPGESLHGSDDEKESEDEYEVDNEFFVPHGHLSEEECQDDENEDNSPEAQKIKMKLKQQEFAQEMKKKTERIQPRIIGPIWVDENGNKPENCPDIIWKSLLKREIMCCAPIDLDLLKNAAAETGSPRQEKKSQKTTTLGDELVKDLIKLVHGNKFNKNFLIKEFQAFISQKCESPVEYTNVSIKKKIKKIAEWKIDSETDKKKKRLCWIVQPSVLEKYGLHDLSKENSWSYNLKPPGNASKVAIVDSEKATKSETEAKDVEKQTPKAKPLTATFSITKFTKVLSAEEKEKQFAASPVPSTSSSTGAIANISRPSPVVKKRVPLLLSVPRGQAIPQSSRNAVVSQFLKKTLGKESSELDVVAVDDDDLSPIELIDD